MTTFFKQGYAKFPRDIGMKLAIAPNALSILIAKRFKVAYERQKGVKKFRISSMDQMDLLLTRDGWTTHTNFTKTCETLREFHNIRLTMPHGKEQPDLERHIRYMT